MSNLLSETMDRLTDIEVAVQKIDLLVKQVYDWVTPCNANKSDMDRAFDALYVQDDLSTATAIIIDYLHETKGTISNLNASLEEEWEKRKTEVIPNGN